MVMRKDLKQEWSEEWKKGGRIWLKQYLKKKNNGRDFSDSRNATNLRKDYYKQTFYIKEAIWSLNNWSIVVFYDGILELGEVWEMN